MALTSVQDLDDVDSLLHLHESENVDPSEPRVVGDEPLAQFEQFARVFRCNSHNVEGSQRQSLQDLASGIDFCPLQRSCTNSDEDSNPSLRGRDGEGSPTTPLLRNVSGFVQAGMGSKRKDTTLSRRLNRGFKGRYRNRSGMISHWKSNAIVLISKDHKHFCVPQALFARHCLVSQGDSLRYHLHNVRAATLRVLEEYLHGDIQGVNRYLQSPRHVQEMLQVADTLKIPALFVECTNRAIQHSSNSHEFLLEVKQFKVIRM